MLNIVKSNNGFTLIELLLYISLSSILLLSTVFFIFTALEARVKQQTIAQVEHQGLQVTQELTQIIRNATQINSPSPGSSSAQLSVDVIGRSQSSTVFDLSEGSIRIKEGSSDPINLNHLPITASDLHFRNLSASDTPGTIHFEFVLTHINAAQRQEYNYSKQFGGSASLRNTN